VEHQLREREKEWIVAVESGREWAVVNGKRYEWYYEVLCLISLVADLGFGLGVRLAGLAGVFASPTMCVCVCRSRRRT
jgi:hypothetical protein